MDKILIKDLLVRCRIGVGTEERREKQDVIINVVLAGDLGQAGKADLLEETLDYRALKKRILVMVEKSQYSLIETLAERVAALCLAAEKVAEVQVTVEKPSALRFARSVAVEIYRRATDQAPVEVFLGIGSNIDPEKNILKALEFLKTSVRILKTSKFYQTIPQGNVDSPPFINGVILIQTSVLPLDLKYSVLRPIEEKLGRIRTEDINAPRPIDIDLLIYGDLVVKDEDLTVPDPEIGEREFLAVPLAEIAPEFILPGTRQRLGEYLRTFENHSMKLLKEYSTQIQQRVSGHE